MFQRQSLDFIGVSDSIIELKQGTTCRWNS
jgi:hypothetical protein